MSRVPVPSRIPLLLGLLAASALPLGAGRAQEALPQVTVVVTTADTHQPLAGAAVEVAGSGPEAATDEKGIARLERVAAGRRTVMVRHAGYLPSRATLDVPENATELIQVAMLPAPPVELEGLEVYGRRESPLDRNGFHSRRRAGQGEFFTREEIERARPHTLTDFLRRVPGLSLAPGGAAVFGRTRASLRGSIGRACAPQVFLDGAQTVGFDLDNVRPEQIEGLEVYHGSATLPAHYNRGTAGCGVVLIWTKVDE